jgi:hypothetical protein
MTSVLFSRKFLFVDKILNEFYYLKYDLVMFSISFFFSLVINILHRFLFLINIHHFLLNYVCLRNPKLNTCSPWISIYLSLSLSMEKFEYFANPVSPEKASMSTRSSWVVWLVSSCMASFPVTIASTISIWPPCNLQFTNFVSVFFTFYLEIHIDWYVKTREWTATN